MMCTPLVAIAYAAVPSVWCRCCFHHLCMNVRAYVPPLGMQIRKCCFAAGAAFVATALAAAIVSCRVPQ